MKAQIQSSTIQGVITSIVGTLALVLRLSGMIDIPESEVGIFINLLWTAGGSLVALYGWIKTWKGRLKATEPLGGFLK